MPRRRCCRRGLSFSLLVILLPGVIFGGQGFTRVGESSQLWRGDRLQRASAWRDVLPIAPSPLVSPFLVKWGDASIDSGRFTPLSDSVRDTVHSFDSLELQLPPPSGAPVRTEDFLFLDDASADLLRQMVDEGDLSPLDLNRASLSDLQEHPLLSPREALAIVRHRERFGAYSSVDELFWVEGLETGRAGPLRSIFYVGSGSLDSFFCAGKHRLEVVQRGWYRIPVGPRVERKYRKETSRPLGNDLGLQSRLVYELGDWLRVGLRGQKQPQEPFFTAHNRYGYGSGSVYLQADGLLKWMDRIVVGNYHYCLGHGLLLQTRGLSFSSYQPYQYGRFTSRPRGGLNYPGGTMPFGAAFSFPLGGGVRLSVMGSYRKPNSRLVGDSIRTLEIVGPIASAAQASCRNTSQEMLGVVDLSYSYRSLLVGVGFRSLHYDHPFMVGRRRVAHESLMLGQHVQGASLYWGWYGRVVQVWGECVTQWGLGREGTPGRFLDRSSFMVGGSWFPLSWLSLTVQVFGYGRLNDSRYQANHASGSRGTDLYGGMVLLHFPAAYQHYYYVQYRFYNQGLQHALRIVLPSRADLRLGGEYRSEGFVERILWQYRVHADRPVFRRGADGRVEGPLRLSYLPVHDARLSVRVPVLPWLYIQVQGLGRYSTGVRGGVAGGWGYAGYGSAGVELEDVGLQFRIGGGYHFLDQGVGVFRMYEPSPRYAMGSVTLSRRGVRVFGYVRYRPFRSLTVWLKAGKTFMSRSVLAGYPAYDRARRNGIDCSLQVLYAPTF